MIRRDPESILVAMKMDPERRQVYVEGPRDRLFLSWLVSDNKNPNSTILEIDTVKLPNTSYGGNRMRLLKFAEFLDGKVESTKFFADADFDRILNHATPKLVWLTDGRDLEGYVIRVECLDKVLRVGVATEKLRADDLLQTIYRLGRKLGFLRLLSEKRDLNLPFQNTVLNRFLKLNDGAIELQLNAYIRALLQNVDISLTHASDIAIEVKNLEEEFKEIPNNQILHGKDAFCIVEKGLSRFGVKGSEAAKLLWTSFERKLVASESNLGAVIGFLCA